MTDVSAPNSKVKVTLFHSHEEFFESMQQKWDADRASEQEKCTFTLNDIKPEVPVGTKFDPHKIFDDRLNPKMHRMFDREDPAPPKVIEYVSMTNATGFSAHGTNGLLFAVTLAYATHYPLTLKPCDIMLAISQGLAIHIKENAKALKAHFSDQQEKYKITIIRNDFVKGSVDNDWFSVFDEFATVAGNTVLDKELVPLMQKEFKSSTQKSLAARNICIMDAMSPYVDYTMHTMCGIPQITLRGTPDEWIHVRTYANYLRKYGLDWWIDELDKVLEKFVNTSQDLHDGTTDSIDLEFWNSMVKVGGGSGGPYYSGWISKMFPYFGSEKFIRNDFTRRFTSGSIPSGISTVDMMWKYYGLDVPLKLHSGVMGCAVNKFGSLRPEMLFCVEDCTPVIPKPKLINGYEVGETTVDGFVITDEAKDAVRFGKLYYPAALHYYHKYNRTDGIHVNCDLCKGKNIAASVSNDDKYDLCPKCVERVVTFLEDKKPKTGFGSRGFF